MCTCALLLNYDYYYNENQLKFNKRTAHVQLEQNIALYFIVIIQIE